MYEIMEIPRTATQEERLNLRNNFKRIVTLYKGHPSVLVPIYLFEEGTDDSQDETVSNSSSCVHPFSLSNTFAMFRTHDCISGEDLEERRVTLILRVPGENVGFPCPYSYTVFQDGGRYEKAYTNLSNRKALENDYVIIVTLLDFQDYSEACYYFNLARKLRPNKHILGVNFLDLDTNPVVVLVDEIEGFYDEWCERKNECFLDCKDGDEARKTLNKFITILRGVVKGLIFLFKANVYHGNLIDGIAVNGDLNVSLYNMRKNGHEKFEDGIAEDIESVHDMITVWLSRGDEFAESRSLRHFQEKLENKSLMKDCNYLWALHDIIFWTPSQKAKFMETRDHFIRENWNNLTKSFKDCFSFDWHSLVPEEEDNPFRKAYDKRNEYDEGPRFGKNVDIVKFWTRARWTYNEYASESGGKYCRLLSSKEFHAKMEETFNVSHVCFSAIESYLLQDDTSGEDISSKTKLKALLDNVRTSCDAFR